MKKTYTLKNGIVIENNTHLGMSVSIHNQSDYYFMLGYDSANDQFYLASTGTRLYEGNSLDCFESEFKEMKEVLHEANNLEF